MNSGGRQYHALDGLRGIAALLVVEYHGQNLFFAWHPQASYLAVDLFFALSGFVLAHAYEEKLRTGLPAGRFMLLRLVRLYPLYIIGLALGVSYAVTVKLLADGNYSWEMLAGSAALSLGFLPTPASVSLDGRSIFPLNYPAWSLFFELAINFCFALTVRFLSTRVLVGIVLLSSCWLVVTALSFGSMNMGHEWASFVGGFARVSFSFFAGVLLYRLRTRVRVFDSNGWASVAVLVLICCLPVPSGWRVAADLAVVVLIFPALIAVASTARPNGATTGIFAALGSASYAIYVLHAPAIMWINAVEARLFAAHADKVTPWIGLVFVAVLFIVALQLSRRYDEPARRWLLQRLSRRTRVPSLA